MKGRTRWVFAAFLFVGSGISYLDRAALSIAAPFIIKDMHFDAAQLGIVFSSFFFGYAIFCFIGGWASDKFGPKRVFLSAFTFWSIFCGLTGAAFNLASLMIARVGLGIGEGPFSATVSKFVNSWFPRQEHASAIGVANAGGPLGAALAGPIFGGLALAFGWRLAFGIISILGIAWVLGWMCYADDKPSESRFVSRSELAEISFSIDNIQEPQGDSLIGYIRRPALLATAYGFFAFNYTIYFLISWFPMYLTSEYNVSLQTMSIMSSVPWVAAFVGMVAGGFLSDCVYRWIGRPILARKLVSGSLLSLSGVGIVLAGQIHNAYGATVVMSVATLLVYLSGTTYWAVISDLVAPSKVGAVGGFVHFLSNCAGIIGPAATGFLVQYSGNFRGAFVLAGSISITGALGIFLFLREKKEGSSGVINTCGNINKLTDPGTESASAQRRYR